jgi:hypothetical protein
MGRVSKKFEKIYSHRLQSETGLTQFRPTAIQRWFSYTGFQKFILFQTPLKVTQKCGKMKKKISNILYVNNFIMFK